MDKDKYMHKNTVKVETLFAESGLALSGWKGPDKKSYGGIVLAYQCMRIFQTIYVYSSLCSHINNNTNSFFIKIFLDYFV